MTDYAFEQRSAAESEQAKLTYLEEQRKLRLAKDEFTYGDWDWGYMWFFNVAAFIFIISAVFIGSIGPSLVSLNGAILCFIGATLIRSRSTTRAGNDRMLLEMKLLREAFETIVKNQTRKGV